jgi:soluble lytic murein transglycosylase
VGTTHKRQELATLALIRLATQDPDQAAQQLEGKWAAAAGPRGAPLAVGRDRQVAALLQSERARRRHFSRVTRDQRPERRPAGLEGARRAAPG